MVRRERKIKLKLLSNNWLPFTVYHTFPFFVVSCVRASNVNFWIQLIGRKHRRKTVSLVYVYISPQDVYTKSLPYIYDKDIKSYIRLR